MCPSFPHLSVCCHLLPSTFPYFCLSPYLFSLSIISPFCMSLLLPLFPPLSLPYLHVSTYLPSSSPLFLIPPLCLSPPVNPLLPGLQLSFNCPHVCLSPFFFSPSSYLPPVSLLSRSFPRITKPTKQPNHDQIQHPHTATASPITKPNTPSPQQHTTHIWARVLDPRGILSRRTTTRCYRPAYSRSAHSPCPYSHDQSKSDYLCRIVD